MTEAAFPNRTRRLSRSRALVAALLCLPLALGCAADERDGDADLQVRWSFEPSPPVVGTSGIRLDVSDVDWSPRNGAKVVLTGVRDGIELVVDTAVGEGAGRYVVPDFRFEVTGVWLLRARVETPDGRWVEVEREVEVVAGAN